MNIDLLKLLSEFVPFDAREESILILTQQFVAYCNTFFDVEEHNSMNRLAHKGHITGSAWIVDAEKKYTLLTHHKKLNRWLQLGGHAEDGEISVLDVAVREAKEESGLTGIKLLSPNIFSVDVHLIPARKDFPAHHHYDIRFLFVADKNEPLNVSDESNDLKWILLEEVHQYNNDVSILSMVEKMKRT